MPSRRTNRIEGLTVWRALLMLGGLLLHGTMGREDYLPFAIINIVSGSFRMGAFFIISGMLTGMALIRQGPGGGAWLQRRMLTLAVPTLIGLIVICPIIRLLLAVEDAGHLPPLSVYHLWFMVALLDYTAMTWLARRCLRSPAWPQMVRAFAPGQALILIGTGAVSFVLMLGTSLLIAGCSGNQASLLRHLPLIAGYAPLFILGLGCGLSLDFRTRLLAGWTLPATVIGIAVLSHAAWGTGWVPATVKRSMEHLLLTAGAAWCPVAATVLILRSALTIRIVPVLLQRLSDASLTMYLTHYPLILAIHILIAPLVLPAWVSFGIMVAGAGTLSYCVHILMVRRSAWMAFMVNGRLSVTPIR